MQILAFLQQHWVLVALLLTFSVAFALFELRMHLLGPKRLSPVLATQFMNRQEPLILDIRDKSKFQQGHLLNAHSVLQSEAENYIKTLKKPMNAPILLVCQTGQQSAVLGSRLKKQGFTEVACLAGGVNAWQSAELPLEKR
jgi:rhodanese-related sulfurtransferase